MSAPHATVVGSGPNGLAAAVVLARAGVQVRVIEAAPELGGGARTQELTLPGFLHDHCSAIHPLAVASPLLRALPLADHGLAWVASPAALAHPFDDGTAALLLRSPADTGATLGPDARAWARHVGGLAGRARALVDDVLSAPARLPRHPLLLARFGLAALRPAAGLARAWFRGPRARALFAGIAAHAARPLEAPGTAAFGLLLAVAGHGDGWPFPRGGAAAIPRALAGVLRAAGGAVETGREVTSLGELEGGAALLDLVPRGVLRVAGPDLPARYARRLAAWRHGPGALKVDWALAGPIPWRAGDCALAATVHLGGTIEELAAAEREAALGLVPRRPFVILAQHTLFDPTRAPEGRHTAWAYAHVPAGWAGDVRAAADAIEAQVERFAPGFRALVLHRAVRPPLQLERENPNLVGGDVGGGENSLAQLAARPTPGLAPWTTPVPGLFLCSAATPPGGGVHGMCGRHAAAAALRWLDRRRHGVGNRSHPLGRALDPAGGKTDPAVT
ncbi:MAG TPA: NAD(P)/FAD-dependent oxidoreductase [Anaeromyxobacter sp.]|nr:NAD(P)/FAD-dependent oxidoreductase [Anaeromyxobacter sp.]